MKDNFYMIGVLQIPQSVILERPLWYYYQNNPDGIKAVFKEMKKLTNYGYDNLHIMWSNIFGDFFSINVHYAPYNYICKDTYIETQWSIHVWNTSGQKSICTLSQDCKDKLTDVLSPENYKLLCKYTEDYTRGLINCSDCNKQIKQSDIAGRYFAGMYCKDCWERKWKAVEAKETYN